MPHSRQMVVTLVTLALTVVFVACGGFGGADGPAIVKVERPNAPIDLDGTKWVLTSLNGSGLVEGSNITLNFAEGQLNGFAGCNNYGAEYTSADEGTLTIPEIEITLQLCQTPEGIMQQEDAYIETLRNGAAYRIIDDRLEIGDASGETTLVFTRKEELLMNPSDLVGTGWQLISWNDSSPIEDATITLVFHDENRGSGSAGCRGYVASYEASGDDIRFPFLGMLGSLERCSEALMLQESEYTTSLEQTTNYHLWEGQLEILTARGEVLVFEPLPEDNNAGLEGSTWALTAFVEEKMVEKMTTPILISTDLLAETGVTATFEDDTVSGSAGCNTYFAAYTLDGSFLTVEAVAATEMACLEPAGVMEQEQSYLGFLKDVTIYRIYGHQLWLETGDGRALVFTAQE